MITTFYTYQTADFDPSENLSSNNNSSKFDCEDPLYHFFESNSKNKRAKLHKSGGKLDMLIN